jgi:2,4'-dihydroxyacetophenone dioxygenase
LQGSPLRRTPAQIVAASLPPRYGRGGVNDRLHNNRRETPVAPMPKEMPNLQELLVDTDKIPWREKSLPGISEKMLWRNEETGASIALIRFAKGSGIPQPHYHSSNQFMFCLSGRYEYTATGVTLTAGSFYCNPKGNVHGPAIAHEDTVVVEVYDGPHYPEKPSWYTDERDAH